MAVVVLGDVKDQSPEELLACSCGLWCESWCWVGVTEQEECVGMAEGSGSFFQGTLKSLLPS